MTSSKLNRKTNTSSSPSLTCQSIPEVTLTFLKSCLSLVSFYFSSGSFSMDFGEYLSSRSRALCVGLTELYVLYSVCYTVCYTVSLLQLLWENVIDTDPGTASVMATLRSSPFTPSALLSLEQKPSLGFVSSYCGYQLKL